MDEAAFRAFMKREGRSAASTQRCIRHVAAFAEWLGRAPEHAAEADLQAYAQHRAGTKDAKTHLWGLRHFFRFVDATDLAKEAGRLRAERIERRPYRLSELPIASTTVAMLAEHGIGDSQQLLDAAGTVNTREGLAGIDRSQINEAVEITRFALIRGVKDVRALLYRRTVGTIDELAQHSAESLIEVTRAYIEEAGFEGVPPTSKEATFTIAEAKRLLS